MRLPPLALIRKRGWLLAPIFFTLIYLLFVKGYPPATAGLYTSGVALVCLLLQKWIWPEVLSRLIVTLIESGKTLLEIGIVLCAAGLMVGIISITGLGFNLVLALTQFGQQGLFVLLVACAIVCIILGMGMPAIAAYSIVALLIAPSLVELSVTPMAAHMFVLFFANVSNFMLPIALASFAAAPIAQESPYKISVQAMKLGIVSYVIPFVFVYNPSLLLSTNLETEIVDYMLSIVGPVFACIVLPNRSGRIFVPAAWTCQTNLDDRPRLRPILAVGKSEHQASDERHGIHCLCCSVSRGVEKEQAEGAGTHERESCGLNTEILSIVGTGTSLNIRRYGVRVETL